MREFECKGCGTSICIPTDESRNPVCPECRGAMLLIGETEDRADMEEFTCPKCERGFFMNRNKIPYKCPFCNYTFSVSPRLKQEERL